ncbi:D-sedoheptulose-7-phosphate isomerase [Dethiosulfatarculus sandiegensis]|uniref:Phosphoheptose isomerase n=1 Tax=Dethiosulfatarculus sandiegensis TaxID=1429043 RepID=A0A0D2GB14_9BACT|nr:SIS domain-containing protein [Dethiosulfatarculus sandiegensis]KIX12012.1 phosphoheptose isomerase [Dethiosulfatarculus sandiegensis]
MENNLCASFEVGLNLLKDFISDKNEMSKVEEVAARLALAYRQGCKTLICGNGGSACDAMHFAEELTGKFRKPRPALPALALTDPGHLTCVGNDYGYDMVFARGVEAHGKRGDFLIALSTSGNSANVVKAVEAATEKGMEVVSFLGGDGGVLADMPGTKFIIKAATSDRIQELHMMILHILIEGVERRLFPENYK